MPIGQVVAFTGKIQGIGNVLKTKVRVSVAHDPSLTSLPPVEKEYDAIWDTGASISVITEKVVTELSLAPSSLAKVDTASGSVDTDAFHINIKLPNNVQFIGIKAPRLPIKGADILIGMDIISNGDFAVSNYHGNTAFSFRTPSMECIDFVVQINKMNKVSRNSQCPCKSGKKFKHCCGK